MQGIINELPPKLPAARAGSFTWLSAAPGSFWLPRFCLSEYSVGRSPPASCYAWKSRKANGLLRRAAQGFCAMSRGGQGPQVAPMNQPAVPPGMAGSLLQPCPGSRCPHPACAGEVSDGFPNEGEQPARQLQKNQYCC